MFKEIILNIAKESIKDKLAIIIITLIIIITGAVLLIYNPFNWSIGKGGSLLKIANTENVISEIRNIAELTSAQYYEEFVIKDSKIEQSKLGFLMNKIRLGDDSTKVELVVIAKGRIRAGFNLRHLEETDIQMKADTLYLTLPKAEIFDVIVNPSEFENFVEEGKWSHDEFVALQSKAKDLIKQNAIDYGILETAEKHGKEKLTALFKGFGFSEVKIDVKE